MSLALDGLDQPHLSYYDDTNATLVYGTISGGVWSRRVVDSVGHGAWYRTSIAVDGNHRPHICYWSRTASGVSTRTSMAASGGACSIAVDMSGNPHIAFRSSGGLYYAR